VVELLGLLAMRHAHYLHVGGSFLVYIGQFQLVFKCYFLELSLSG